MALLALRGIGASPGIGRGTAQIYRGKEARAAAPPPSPAVLLEHDRAAELQRLREAIALARADLDTVRTQVGEHLGPSEAAVFEAQALFLEDPAICGPLEAAILERGLSAAQALEDIMEAAAGDLEALADPYLSARAADLRDVKRRVAGALLGTAATGLEDLPEGSILIARDLLPSDTIGLQPGRVQGIVLEAGTATAHAAILARGLGLPLVVGAGSAVWQVQPGQQVLLDGAEGTVLVGPDAAERQEYRRRCADQDQRRTALQQDAAGPVCTADGRYLELAANVASEAEARLARANGAAGIGLLRTEFVLAALCAGRDEPPDEAALTGAYGAILAAMGDRPVVVRTMDAGGDKPLPFLDFEQEANPFLGWRGIRIALDREQLFVSQIRALLRAAARHGTDLRLMFPMVSGLEEFRRARQIVDTVHAQEDGSLARPLRVGVMIEVPAAALIADTLAREVDFFSLGTNDLVQYALACDRTNARINHLCQFHHPGVLRLIDMVVRAAHAANKPVGVCGEAAADPLALPLLVGLGVDELSVAAGALPEVRQLVRPLSYQQLQALAAEACAKATSQEVLELVRRPARI